MQWEFIRRRHHRGVTVGGKRRDAKHVTEHKVSGVHQVKTETVFSRSFTTKVVVAHYSRKAVFFDHPHFQVTGARCLTGANHGNGHVAGHVVKNQGGAFHRTGRNHFTRHHGGEVFLCSRKRSLLGVHLGVVLLGFRHAHVEKRVNFINDFFQFSFGKMNTHDLDDVFKGAVTQFLNFIGGVKGRGQDRSDFTKAALKHFHLHHTFFNVLFGKVGPGKGKACLAVARRDGVGHVLQGGKINRLGNERCNRFLKLLIAEDGVARNLNGFELKLLAARFGTGQRAAVKLKGRGFEGRRNARLGGWNQDIRRGKPCGLLRQGNAGCDDGHAPTNQGPNNS